MFILILLSICSNQSFFEKARTARVDIIEYNHFYDEDGNHAYDQIIFYERSPSYNNTFIIAWMLVDESDNLNNMFDLPYKDYNSNIYKIKIFRYDALNISHRVKLKTVEAKIFYETYTTIDPERVNKKTIEEKDRVGLFIPYVDLLERAEKYEEYKKSNYNNKI